MPRLCRGMSLTKVHSSESVTLEVAKMPFIFTYIQREAATDLPQRRGAGGGGGRPPTRDGYYKPKPKGAESRRSRRQTRD